MMSHIVLQIGILGAAFIFLLIAFLLPKKHMHLKFMTLFFVIFMVILLGKTSIDAQTLCSPVVDYEMKINTSHTQFNYTTACYTPTNTTPTLFSNVVVTYFVLFVMFYFLFIFYHVFHDKAKELLDGFRRWKRNR